MPRPFFNQTRDAAATICQKKAPCLACRFYIKIQSPFLKRYTGFVILRAAPCFKLHVLVLGKLLVHSGWGHSQPKNAIFSKKTECYCFQFIATFCARSTYFPFVSVNKPFCDYHEILFRFAYASADGRPLVMCHSTLCPLYNFRKAHTTDSCILQVVQGSLD